MSLPAIKMSTKDLRGALAQSQVQETAAGGIGGFLKFDFQTGEWSYGRDQEEVTGDKVLINVATFGHGWVLWLNSEAQKNLVRFTDPLPEPPASAVDAKGNTVEASQARAFQGAFLDGNDQLTFETNSYGGRQGVDALLAAVKQRAASGEGDLYPIVKLSSSSYVNKAYGNKTIHNPVFEIVGWADEFGVEEEEPEQIEAPAPTRRRRRKS